MASFKVRSKGYASNGRKEESAPPLTVGEITAWTGDGRRTSTSDVRLHFLTSGDLHVAVDFKWGGGAPPRWREFLQLDDTSKSERLKIMACLHTGPRFLRRLVNSRPAVLGRLLETKYISHEGGIEIVYDTRSNFLSSFICGKILSYASSVTIEGAFFLEESDDEYLPERVLGTFEVDWSCIRGIRES